MQNAGKRTLKLGTRGSLLAMTQSAWVARELEGMHPGLAVEQVKITTKGDQITDVPLHEIDGKDFFVKEIDEALAAGQVDFTVHSLKDLSLTRPSEFKTGIIPPRANSRDVILWGPHALKRWKKGKTLRIGTSSPRRVENLQTLLPDLLPRRTPENSTPFELVNIRGNINTRLSRVFEKPGKEKQMDAVVLAAAGLSRVWQDPKAREEMRSQFDGVRWMVLPLDLNPTAPGQGALTLECRADDTDTLDILNAIHDLPSQHQVEREREVLLASGGGCHQRFGASAFVGPHEIAAFRVFGKSHLGEAMDEFESQMPKRKPAAGVSSSGILWSSSLLTSKILPEKHSLRRTRSKAFFLTHANAVTQEVKFPRGARLWVAGASSWKNLARKGHWIEGCSESFGWNWLIETMIEPMYQLPEKSSWTLLTHEMPRKEEPAQMVRTYRLEPSFNLIAAEKRIQEATHLFWRSPQHFRWAKEFIRPGQHHFCGAGKTYAALKNENLESLTPVANEHIWRQTYS